MILVIDPVFRGSYSCYYDYPDHVEYIKNSDINQMKPYEVKMLLHYFLQNLGLDPEEINYNKCIRDLVYSINSRLKKEGMHSRIMFIR